MNYENIETNLRENVVKIGKPRSEEQERRLHNR